MHPLHDAPITILRAALVSAFSPLADLTRVDYGKVSQVFLGRGWIRPHPQRYSTFLENAVAAQVRNLTQKVKMWSVDQR